MVAFSVVAVDAFIQASTPDLAPLGTIVFLTMAAALGTATGATFALVAQRAPATQVGAVTGIVGAAGGLGGFVPPLVMGSIFGHSGEYRTGLLALSGMALLVLLLAATTRRTPAPAARAA
jgi:MFS transporter, NNP family, nitrate/nitrite transporter